MYEAIIYAVIFLVAAIVAYVTAPKPPKPLPPAILGDGDFPQTDDGTEQYVIFGDVWLPDWIVLAYGNQRTSAIRTKGGK